MSDFLLRVWDILVEYRWLYLSGAAWTLVISVIGTVVGFVIGLGVGIVRTVPEPREGGFRRFLLKLANVLLSIYIDFFRSTPMMVQAMVFYYGLAALGTTLPKLTAGLIVVSINTGAYLSEIVRGGIVSIDKGQFEAARSLGLSHFDTMRSIILPQVIRNILPACANEFIVNVKDTSVLSVISVTELFFTTKTIAGSNFLFAEAYLITTFIYLIMTVTITKALRALERRMDGPRDFKLVANQMQLLYSDDILEQNKIV